MNRNGCVVGEKGREPMAMANEPMSAEIQGLLKALSHAMKNQIDFENQTVRPEGVEWVARERRLRARVERIEAWLERAAERGEKSMKGEKEAA